MKTYMVSKDGRKVWEFSDEPGRITSTALVEVPPAHPLVSAFELAPDLGGEVREVLDGADSVDLFIEGLREHGFTVTQIDSHTGDAVGAEG